MQDFLEKSGDILAKLQQTLKSLWNHPRFSKKWKILALIGTVFPLRYLVIKAYRRYKRYPPGPVGVPFFGSLFWIARDPLGFIHKMPEKYGPLTSFKWGLTNVVMPCSTDTHKQIYVKSKTVGLSGLMNPHETASFMDAERGEWASRRALFMNAIGVYLTADYSEKAVAKMMKNHFFPKIDKR